MQCNKMVVDASPISWANHIYHGNLLDKVKPEIIRNVAPTAHVLHRMKNLHEKVRSK
jgi:hypothetical protein